MDALRQYLGQIARRLRVLICLRGAALTITLAAVLSVGLAWWLTLLPGSPVTLTLFRIVLFAIAGGSALCAIPPLLRMNSNRAARLIERKVPAFDQRLITFTERAQADRRDPFLPLLAESAVEIARNAAPEKIVSRRALIGMATLMAVGAMLLGLTLASSGPIGRNAKALWGRGKLFSIETASSQKAVRRGGNVIVTARLNGFKTTRANLWTRKSGASAWTSAAMLTRDSDSEFALQLTKLPKDTDYYVESEGIRSRVSHLNVIDLPAVTHIVVTYPTGIAGIPTDGDIVAPAGAVARLQIETDRPMLAAQLTLDEGDPVNLAARESNRISASVPVLRDGGYHVSMFYNGEMVQVSDEHAIEVMMRDNAQPHPRSLLEGVHAAPVPAGYEQAVADYYRRLSELQATR
jgi:hypothetical protein